MANAPPYYLANMRGALLAGLSMLVCVCPAIAQAPPGFPIQGARVTDVVGQVLAPEGGPLSTHLRFQLITENGSRPPEYMYTDSKGGFTILGLVAFERYSILVESDGATYGRTVHSFMTSGRRMTLRVLLNRFERPLADLKGNSVSVAELKQHVPREARREYDAAIKRMLRQDHAGARAQLERALAIFPDFVAARNELATLLMKQGKLAEAEQHLQHALRVDASAVHPLLNLGLCLYRQEKYAEAIVHLEKAIQLQPGHATGQMLLGIALVMSGREDRAEPVLARAYELGGKSCARANFYLSRLYARKKDYSRAAAALETYLRDAPDDPNRRDLERTLEKLRDAKPQAEINKPAQVVQRVNLGT